MVDPARLLIRGCQQTDICMPRGKTGTDSYLHKALVSGNVVNSRVRYYEIVATSLRPAFACIRKQVNQTCAPAGTNKNCKLQPV